MNKDTVTGIIGAVVLVAAMTGVFFYERGQFQEYTVAWQELAADSQPAPGATLAQGESRDHTFTLENASAVATVQVLLRWSENTADEFELAVTPPGGQKQTRPATGGRLVLEFDGAAPPADLTIAERSREAALEQARASFNETALQAAQGDWTVSVKLLSAMRPADVPLLPEVEGSSGYTLSFTYTTWVPQIETD